MNLYKQNTIFICIFCLTKKISVMDSKIKEIISNEYAKVFAKGSHMHDYCVKESSNAVVLDSGFVYIFKKPKIKKDFCFGYRLSSENSNEYDNANNMCSHVKNDNGNYFKEKNLEEFEHLKKLLQSGKTFYAVATYVGDDVKICSVYDSRTTQMYYNNCIKAELTKNDINNLIAVINEEERKFEKRLNTYLKRYGTSKLHTWSYWVDA